jgi:hypothetical protein
LQKGDLIEIISTRPTGVWVGKANGQVGHFKFINVQVLRLDRPPHSNSSSKEDLLPILNQNGAHDPDADDDDGLEEEEVRQNAKNVSSEVSPTTRNQQQQQLNRPNSVGELLRRIELDVSFLTLKL